MSVELESKMSKAAMIRDAMASLPGCGTREIVEHVREKFGVDVKAADVASVNAYNRRRDAKNGQVSPSPKKRPRIDLGSNACAGENYEAMGEDGSPQFEDCCNEREFADKFESALNISVIRAADAMIGKIEKVFGVTVARRITKNRSN